MSGPKVVVIGAGSLFFGRKAIWAMTHVEGLREGRLSLVDADPKRLDQLMGLAHRAVESTNSPLKLEGSSDYRNVLEGADFVVLSFSNRNVHYRRIDCDVSAKYGIRMCSGDTIGPGGIFRAMRELPTILQVADDVTKYCPDAWVINYINPTAVNGIGLMRYANVKSFALCDSLHMPYIKQRYMQWAGLEGADESQFELKIAGVNHFTWVLECTYEGRDVSPQIRTSLEQEARKEKDEGYAKRRFNYSFMLELWDIFGCCPACVSHTKEYLPYWQGRNVAPETHPPLAIFDCDERQAQQDAMWQEIAGYNSGKLPIDHFHEHNRPDHATDIIEAMWTGNGKPFYVNTANNGAVNNLPDDAFLELLCDLDMNGPRPRPVGAFPLGLRSLQYQMLDTHELTAEGIIKRDRSLLRRAMMTDPLIVSITDGDAVFEELWEQEREAIMW